MQKFLLQWQDKIAAIEKNLAGIDIEKARVKPAKESWCINEILGHLIDSAIINHRRFILMQIENNLVFEGYDQERWVELQNYIIKDLKTLIETWEILNLNILSALLEIPAEFWAKSFDTHGSKETAFQDFPEDVPVSAKQFVQDYFEHMKHHLKQIFKLADISFSF